MMAASERWEKMSEMDRTGLSMSEIGGVFGISRQRVQALLKRLGVSRADGGFDLKKAEEYGFSSLPELHSYLDRYTGCCEKYRRQRQNASMRGVEWGFNLKLWLDAWGDQWCQRGRGGESLVMCRIGDVGPYAPGNVFIASCGQNSSDYQALKKARMVDMHV